MHRRQISWYKQWVSFFALILITLIIAACAAPSTAPTEDVSGLTSDSEAASETDVAPVDTPLRNEAPLLIEQVDSGTLPPLEERLPVNPQIVTPHETIGQYGGDWRLGLRGGNDSALLYRTIGYEQLMRWNLEWTEVEPNMVERVEVSDDATEYTFHMRKGMKWSDGADFTADDILWWYENIFSHAEITPSPSAFLTVVVDGEKRPAVFEKIDDYTFKVNFAAPNGMFLAQLAAPNGRPMIPRPAHWLEQFHLDFNTDASAAAEEEGFESWVALIQDRMEDDAFFRFADMPTLNPWMIVQPYGTSTVQVQAIRNPYYWKVDPEGNQLPYIDRVIYEVGEDVNTLVLNALNGEIDNQGRHIASNENKALFVDNQEAGDYRIVEQLPTGSNFMVLNLNLLHADPVMRELMQTKDFRIALSHAINRQEIIDLILVGEGTPHQPAPLPGTAFYNERLATQYTAYDPALANQLLDEIGLTERDENGFRLRPDGEPLRIAVEVITVAVASQDTLELIRQQWEEVGIFLDIKTQDRSLYFERHAANAHDASVWGGEGGSGWDVYINPKNVIPMHNNGSRFALPWAYWFNNPDAANAEEPPDDVKAQMALYQQVMTVADDAERAELMQEVLEMAADQFYLLGISTPASGYRIVSNRMRNVPVMVGSWTWPTPGPSNPEQYFYQNE